MKLFQHDMVGLRSDHSSLGVVFRSYHEDELPPEASLIDPIMRPLLPGEVAISWLRPDPAKREILQESELSLTDRTFQLGDICRKGPGSEAACSGVVTRLSVRALLEHSISGEMIGWRTHNDIKPRKEAEVGDYIVYDDWVGQVVELFDENVVQVTSTGQLLRLPELGSHLVIGEKGDDILPQSDSRLQSFLGLLGNNHKDDTVIAVKHTVYAITWLALNQMLDPSELENRPRPQRFWYGPDVSKLTLLRSRSDTQLHIDDRVKMKDATGLPYTTHGKDDNSSETIHVQTFTVRETETNVEVLWQDGTRQTLKATDVVPHLNPDEHECWPGDHVLWTGDGQKLPAVVQSVDAPQRTARIMFSDSGTHEVASVLELDAHGISDTVFAEVDDLSVRRGDYVFILPEGVTTGFEPWIPHIGEVERWVHEPVFPHLHLTGWRKEMADIGAHIANHRGSDGFVDSQFSDDTSSLLWIGEVSDLRMDGLIEVTHPNGATSCYKLNRLTKLRGVEQLEDVIEADETADDGQSDNGPWLVNENGVWRIDTDPHGIWEDDSDDNDTMLVDSLDIPSDQPSVDSSFEMFDSMPAPDDIHDEPLNSPATEEEEEEEEGHWKRFHILSKAPQDHTFISSAPSQHSRTFITRLNREYRILSTSLPDTILVRTYDDRADLLRSLIIGPKNTPYEDAPFVIDWMLDSNFPTSPPLAHFASWTNGNGRVNPNLYEDGKICLSILGTWAGDKNETWSPRSSLLQVLVSIQGLVLVKEPFFCEPSYERLRGTEEGRVNSRLYNEKAYVLARGFVRHAIEMPPSGLEEEITWLYHKNNRLHKILADSRHLIEQAQGTASAEIDPDAAVSLTAGGVISLQRILTRLENLSPV